MKKIYVVYSQTYTVLARIIKWISKEPYSHLSISLDSSLRNMYSFGRKYYKNPFIGRFVIENIKEGLYKFKKNSKLKVFEVLVTNEQYNNIQTLINNYKTSSIKYKYNFLGLIYAKFGIKKIRKNKQYCAEFVYNILSDDTVKVVKKINSPISLNNFLDIDSYILIYEGLAKDY